VAPTDLWLSYSRTGSFLESTGGSVLAHAEELVETIDPHTEADPAALLVQFLIAFGNVIGRSPYFTAGADQHFPNEFAVLVGASSKGRKGSSWSAIQHIVGMADPNWLNACVQTGLSSGEGLIWAVRDEITAQEPLRTGKERRISGYQTIVKDRGLVNLLQEV
jgi:hypothetical protein